jgi:hypothetical protein
MGVHYDTVFSDIEIVNLEEKSRNKRVSGSANSSKNFKKRSGRDVGCPRSKWAESF